MNIGPMELLIILALMVGGILWLLALLDCLRNEPPEGDERLIWVLVILLGSVLGALLYLVLRRPKRIEQYGK